MNFLLHHHLAARDLGAPASALGAMLPDVWRMADRRAHVRGGEATSERSAVRAVLDGVAHHLDVDAWFHAAPVFTNGEQATREALRGASNAPKLSVFAHVTWELCLDGALLRRVGLDSMLASLRHALDAARPDAHHRAALASLPSLRERTAGDRERFEKRVDQILDAIALGPWIGGYATGEGIVERLEGVRSRLRLAPLPAADRARVGRALDRLAPAADEAAVEIGSWQSSAGPSKLTVG